MTGGRAIGTLTAAAVAALWLAACGPGPAAIPGRPEVTATPAGDAAVAAALDADAALRSVLAGTAEPGVLGRWFAGPARIEAERRAADMRTRHRVRTESVSRRVAVHVSEVPRGVEVVLAIAGTLALDGGAPHAFLRQWRAALVASGGGWMVVEAADLPPPQWWPVPPA